MVARVSARPALLPLLLIALGCRPAPTLAPAPTVVPAVAAVASTPQEARVSARTIVLVRHAEKQSEERDPALSTIGQARARCLAEVLADVGVTHLFNTEFRRTHETLAPLAERVHLTPKQLPAAATTEWLAALRGLSPGALAVVAGHSNSIPGLVAALDAGEVTIEHGDYDWMLVVSLPDRGSPTLLRLHYCVDAEPAR